MACEARRCDAVASGPAASGRHTAVAARVRGRRRLAWRCWAGHAVAAPGLRRPSSPASAGHHPRPQVVGAYGVSRSMERAVPCTLDLRGAPAVPLAAGYDPLSTLSSPTTFPHGCRGLLEEHRKQGLIVRSIGAKQFEFKVI
ncbi:unnamed protein product [Urochloa humidicola]